MTYEYHYFKSESRTVHLTEIIRVGTLRPYVSCIPITYTSILYEDSTTIMYASLSVILLNI